MGNFINELQNYQTIPRELVFDKSISDRARFVYVFMACKPDEWDFYLEPMAKDIGYSVDTLRKYINELVSSGWLVKGVQQKNNGLFGAVEYTLKATKNSVSEKYRHGEIQIQDNIDIIEKRDVNKQKNEIDKSISKKDELFEKCWLAYKRKGSKKKSKEYWDKLSNDEKQCVLPHIKAYVSTRELSYQKDFERYLRDRIFNTLVIKNNSVVYDPTRKTEEENEYLPATDGFIRWDESRKKYLYFGMFTENIVDGYSDNDRPNGATLMLNNGRGKITWNNNTKQWEKS